MTWTILSDNRTCNDLLQTEHGLSILLETDKYRILLDTGASDVFIRNAEKIGIDLSTVNYVFISHGHSDHAGGLKHFMEINNKAAIEREQNQACLDSAEREQARTKFKVIVSPHAVSGKFFSKRRYFHSITTEWPEDSKDRFLMVDQTCEVCDDIHVIAHIPQSHPIPQGNQHLFIENA
ncbi:MAG: MBL fold metallo-hydrolase, partial [Bacteroidaceae bacterium]|nr:MBL fold metallo-hydrolase [Bacteroidaceae bacterium]